MASVQIVQGLNAVVDVILLCSLQPSSELLHTACLASCMAYTVQSALQQHVVYTSCFSDCVIVRL